MVASFSPSSRSICALIESTLVLTFSERDLNSLSKPFVFSFSRRDNSTSKSPILSSIPFSSSCIFLLSSFSPYLSLPSKSLSLPISSVLTPSNFLIMSLHLSLNPLSSDERLFLRVCAIPRYLFRDDAISSSRLRTDVSISVLNDPTFVSKLDLSESIKSTYFSSSSDDTALSLIANFSSISSIRLSLSKSRFSILS